MNEEERIFFKLSVHSVNEEVILIRPPPESRAPRKREARSDAKGDLRKILTQNLKDIRDYANPEFRFYNLIHTCP
jgi:hypothetical protein